jgi:hypothetical protein
MSRYCLAFALVVMLAGCRREQSPGKEEEKNANEKQVILILHALLDVDMRVIRMSPCPLRTDHHVFESGNLHETLITGGEKGTLTFFKNGKEQPIPEQVRDARYHRWLYDYRPEKGRLYPISFKCREKLPFGTKFTEIRLLGEIEKKAEQTFQQVDGTTLTGESNGRYNVYEATAIFPDSVVYP